ncbi:MAG: hypothetical protein LBJ32_04635 [Oscillospiraceae bacterium]|jgi:hypothetical protein|nr:hypothetical protein [Oscillospiraceae bacterium]
MIVNAKREKLGHRGRRHRKKKSEEQENELRKIKEYMKMQDMQNMINTMILATGEVKFMLSMIYENDSEHSVFYYLSDKDSPECFLYSQLSQGKIENFKQNFLKIRQEILKILLKYYDFLNLLSPKISTMEEYCEKFLEGSLLSTFRQDLKIKNKENITDEYVVDFCESVGQLFTMIARNTEIFGLWGNA